MSNKGFTLEIKGEGRLTRGKRLCLGVKWDNSAEKTNTDEQLLFVEDKRTEENPLNNKAGIYCTRCDSYLQTMIVNKYRISKKTLFKNSSVLTCVCDVLKFLRKNSVTPEQGKCDLSKELTPLVNVKLFSPFIFGGVVS